MNRDPLLIWNGLVTRVPRSGGETHDGKVTSATSANRGRGAGSSDPATGAPLGSGTNHELVPEPSPTDPDPP